MEDDEDVEEELLANLESDVIAERRRQLLGPRDPRVENDFDDVVSDAAQYGSVQFWDQRYAEEYEPFEWYYDYEYFRETICANVQRSARTMIAGCGSSNLIGDMADDGFDDLVGIDISRVVIAQLKYRYREYPQITFNNANLTDSDLPEGSFEAIIDKALLDSLLCSHQSGVTASQYLYEIERLLTADGVFILISHGTPELRLPLLEQYDLDEPYFTPWVVEVQALVKPIEFKNEYLDVSDPSAMYFVYVCRKDPELVRRKTMRLLRQAKRQKMDVAKNAHTLNTRTA